jgi:hypothetical protein
MKPPKPLKPPKPPKTLKPSEPSETSETFQTSETSETSEPFIAKQTSFPLPLMIGGYTNIGRKQAPSLPNL